MPRQPADMAGDELVWRGSSGAIITGLQVADSSTFPSGIGVGPMLRVMAVGRSVSRTILAESPPA